MCGKPGAKESNFPFQPLFQRVFRHGGDIFQHPLVADVVETTFDVTFQNPLRSVRFGQQAETTRYGIVAGAVGSKSVGIWVGGRFVDGFEAQQVQGLHRTDAHHGDAQRPLLAIGFGNVDTAHGLRPVSASSEARHGRPFGLWGAPLSSWKDTVNTGRSFARVFCHPPHGEHLGSQGATKYILQRLHFPKLLFNVPQTALTQWFGFNPYARRYSEPFALSVILYPHWRCRRLLPSYLCGYLPTATRDQFGFTTFRSAYGIDLASCSTPGEKGCASFGIRSRRPLPLDALSLAGPPPHTKGLRVILFSPIQRNGVSSTRSLMLRMSIFPSLRRSGISSIPPASRIGALWPCGCRLLYIGLYTPPLPATHTNVGNY